MYRANYKLVYIIDTVNVAYYNDLTVTLPIATLTSMFFAMNSVLLINV